MKINKIFLAINLIVVITVFIYCEAHDKKLEAVLEMAAENRPELEKVLEYYSSPKDSLKYRAAVFLIKNMPYHSGCYSEKLDRYDAASDSMYSLCHYNSFSKHETVNNVIRSQIFSQIFEFYKEKLGDIPSYDLRQSRDAEKISAKLLIENIEYAFKAWEFPWSRNYSFDQFCKFILPYRYGQESYESWRPFFMNQLSWVKDSVKNFNDPLEVAGLIREWIGRNATDGSYFESLGNIDLKCSNFLKSFMSGKCHQRAGLSTCCLRSMGIPTAMITFPKWGKFNNGHAMYAVLSPDGRWVNYSLGDRQSDPDRLLTGYNVPKIFITHFDFFQTMPDPVVYRRLSYLLYSEDITSDYINTADVEIDIDMEIVGNHKFAFICVFDRPNWQPVFWGEIEKKKVRFKNMGVEMVYLPVIYENNEQVPVHTPFKIDKNGQVKDIRLNKKGKIKYSFNRKFPVAYPDIVKLRCEDLIGGKFEFAEDEMFSTPKTIFEISDIPPYRPHIVKVKQVKTKYARYSFPNITRKPLMGPGQIAFYTMQNGSIRELKGNYFGSSGVTTDNLNQLFDEDILSYVVCYPYEITMGENKVPSYIFYQGSGDSVWAGIEFDKEEVITHVGYCPRNDKNGIYPGMNYELLYWQNRWESLGVKTATDSMITYNNIPEGALLWLRNLDEGEAERICTIEKGKLCWW